jgi:anthranilate synthase/aminodeoxychorismate synthase-like glutamine amidotransferase
MILFVDNYDSFTFNLVSMIGALNGDLRVVRNDAVSVDDVRGMRPSGIVVSPGPGKPADAGVCPALVKALYAQVPILGVCLGHQVIVEAFGGTVGHAQKPVHGKASPVVHDGTGLLMGLPSPFSAGRYHSLAAVPDKVPDCLAVQARTAEGEVMAVRHRDRPCHGLQFHPESVLTAEGEQILRNFVLLCREARHA